MHLQFFLLATILVQSHDALPNAKSISVCDLCIDIVTDIDEWLTAEHTEADIVAWVEQICSSLSEVIPEEICTSAIEAALPSIIDGIVNQYMTPMQVCQTLAACPT